MTNKTKSFEIFNAIIEHGIEVIFYDIAAKYIYDMNNSLAESGVKLSLCFNLDRKSNMDSDVKSRINTIRSEMELHTEGEVFLDTHKLASILTSSILRHRPVVQVVDKNHEDCPGINEALALWSGLNILLMYSINLLSLDDMTDDEKKTMQQNIFEYINGENNDLSFFFPDVMHNNPNYNVAQSLIDAFYRIAIYCPANLYGSMVAIERALNHIYFFLDDFSKDAVYEIVEDAWMLLAKPKYDYIKKEFIPPNKTTKKRAE